MLRELRIGLLERITRRRLLPENLEILRLNSPAYILGTKGYPPIFFINSNKEADNSPVFSLANYDLKQAIGFTGVNNDILMMRKANPHCLYDLMLVKPGEPSSVGIYDLSEKDRVSFYGVASNFAKFCESRGLYPNISWTYDPETKDRPGGQSQQWYHMHLNSRTEKEKREILENHQPLADIKSTETRRTLID